MLATRTVAKMLAVVGTVCCAQAGMAQIRAVEWNVTNWSAAEVAARGAAFQTAIYGINPANGLSMAPDLLIVQEIIEGTSTTVNQTTTGQANVNEFLTLLNTAPNSPGDWAAVPYVANQGDTGNAALYRTSKLVFVPGSTITLGVIGVDVGSMNNQQSPRDNQRWTFLPVGYSGESAKIYVYSAHMKAGSNSDDQQRRQPEGLRIRENANLLPTGSHFLLFGDFNAQSSSQLFYQYLTQFNSMASDARMIQSGQFFDPINKPGSWENNGAFRNIHTQEPSTQMDSRHDQILISSALRDGQGWSYLPAITTGNILAAFRDATANDGMQWYDPNHSYMCWGNDGESYDLPIRTGGNSQVGSAIASALITTVDNGGHLPVLLDLQVPAKLGAPTAGFNFGTVGQNSTQTTTIQITNAADFTRFSKNGTGWGIDALTYSFSFVSGSGFSIQGGNGPFNRAATNPAIANSHTIVLDTSTQGTKTATLRITSDDPDNPTRDIVLTAIVGTGTLPPPPAGNYDVNGDGQITVEDVYRWYNVFTDVNQNGTVDVNDVIALRTYLRWYEMQDITDGRR